MSFGDTDNSDTTAPHTEVAATVSFGETNQQAAPLVPATVSIIDWQRPQLDQRMLAQRSNGEATVGTR